MLSVTHSMGEFLEDDNIRRESANKLVQVYYPNTITVWPRTPMFNPFIPTVAIMDTAKKLKASCARSG